jgi:hypothetical protein
MANAIGLVKCRDKHNQGSFTLTIRVEGTLVMFVAT